MAGGAKRAQGGALSRTASPTHRRATISPVTRSLAVPDSAKGVSKIPKKGVAAAAAAATTTAASDRDASKGKAKKGEGEAPMTSPRTGSKTSKRRKPSAPASKEQQKEHQRIRQETLASRPQATTHALLGPATSPRDASPSEVAAVQPAAEPTTGVACEMTYIHQRVTFVEYDSEAEKERRTDPADTADPVSPPVTLMTPRMVVDERPAVPGALSVDIPEAAVEREKPSPQKAAADTTSSKTPSPKKQRGNRASGGESGGPAPISTSGGVAVTASSQASSPRSQGGSVEVVDVECYFVTPGDGRKILSDVSCLTPRSPKTEKKGSVMSVKEAAVAAGIEEAVVLTLPGTPKASATFTRPASVVPKKKTSPAKKAPPATATTPKMKRSTSPGKKTPKKQSGGGSLSGSTNSIILAGKAPRSPDGGSAKVPKEAEEVEGGEVKKKAESPKGKSFRGGTEPQVPPQAPAGGGPAEPSPAKAAEQRVPERKSVPISGTFVQSTTTLVMCDPLLDPFQLASEEYPSPARGAAKKKSGALSARRTTGATTAAGGSASPRKKAKAKGKYRPGHVLIPPQREEWQGVYTVVLDMDETLLWHPALGEVYERPGAKDLLKGLKGRCEVVLWTASTRTVTEVALGVLNIRPSDFTHIITRDDRWFSWKRSTKDIRFLGRDPGRVVVVENSPYSLQLNKQNGILVSDFNSRNAHRDDTLFRVDRLIQSLIASNHPVPDFLDKNPDITLNHFRLFANSTVSSFYCVG